MTSNQAGLCPGEEGQLPESSDINFDQLVGAWRLESAVAVDSVGSVSHPFGEVPEGVLLYTPDQWVSATITSVGPEATSVPCFYAGPVAVRGDHVEHLVVVGAAPFSPGTVQLRGVHFDLDCLKLTARTADPAPRSTVLTWRRPV